MRITMSDSYEKASDESSRTQTGTHTGAHNHNHNITNVNPGSIPSSPIISGPTNSIGNNLGGSGNPWASLRLTVANIGDVLLLTNLQIPGKDGEIGMDMATRKLMIYDGLSASWIDANAYVTMLFGPSHSNQTNISQANSSTQQTSQSSSSYASGGSVYASGSSYSYSSSTQQTNVASGSAQTNTVPTVSDSCSGKVHPDFDAFDRAMKGV
jgi:hypothetical protein